MKKLLLVLILCAPMVGFCQTDFVKDFTGILSYNEGQILALAEAIPEEKYSWTPQDGVRNVGDVLLHIAETNYFITSGMGFPLPAGVKVEELGKIKGKKAIIETVKNSIAYVKEKTATLTDANLSEKFKLPFGEFSKRSGVLILLDHNAEHKGQLIAYARSNSITPPWSKGGEN